MTTFAIILWFNATLLLCCVVGYGVWLPIRRQRLRNDLMILRTMLRNEVQTLGMVSDPEFVARVSAIDRVIAKPELVDWLLILYVNVEPSYRDRFPQTESPNLRKVLDRYWTAVWKRIALNLLGERLSGVLLMLSLPFLEHVLLPWAKRRRARSEVAASDRSSENESQLLEKLLGNLVVLVYQVIGQPAAVNR